MNTDMKITVNPGMEHLRQFVRQLPELFPVSGEVLHDGRNQIRAFDIGGERLVVKRYKRPSAFNAVMYSFFRKSKARRSDFTPLTAATERFPTSDSLPVLAAFARFTVRLHEKGICHEDFNQTNILWRHDEATGRYDFQLIDINRMKFLRRPLRPDECMINLRRLSCPAVAFLYILDRYAETRQWDMDDTLLRGTFFRLLFGRRQQFKKRFKARKLAAAGKKQG